jgi:hypothetical protein
MLARTFKSRALVEGRRYAKDRMVFLREFCQNARDAGATVIRVSTHRVSEVSLKLVFDDDGQGMSFDHAKAYLFTLYASSKEQESDSAGRFGVGFWSVLLSSPTAITISSKPAQGEAWKIRMDGDLQSLRRESPAITRRGTRIVVTYAESDNIALEDDAEKALERYCCYLRRNDKAKSPLPVLFNDKNIGRPFSLDSPCWMSFSGKHIEGAVGLTETPGVEIFAQGLPVWQGTVIDELQYGAKRQTPVHLPKGLAPYYLINGHDLNVTYDRRAIVDDRALKTLRKTAQMKMDELLRRYLDQISPRPLHQRLLDSIRRGVVLTFTAHKAASIAVIILILAALTFWLIPTGMNTPADARTHQILGKSTGASPSAVIAQRPLGNPMVYNGPTTELPLWGSRLSLNYRSETDQAFRIAAMETLDNTQGIVAGPTTLSRRYPRYTCTKRCVDIAVSLDAQDGLVILPCPSSHAVSKGSVYLDRRPIPLYISTRGEPIIKISGRMQGILTYRTGVAGFNLSPARRRTLLQLPRNDSAPAEFRAAVKKIRRKRNKDTQIDEAVRYIESRIAYDASHEVTSRYEAYLKQRSPKQWMPFVFSLGRGDCDVKNTLLVHMLRALGIPSRLAVGPIGKAGQAIPLMHAWVEFHHQSWRVADATGRAGAADRLRPEIGEAMATDSGVATPEEQTAFATEPIAAVDTSESNAVPLPLASTGIKFGLNRNYLSGTLFGLAMGAGVLLLLTTLSFAGKSGRMVTPTSTAVQEEVAAKIAAGALVFPEWWHLGDGLKNRAILPCLGAGRSISISEAERLAERGALFVSEEHSKWRRAAIENRAAVLDGSSEILKQVASLLPSITHLDEIDRLDPIPHTRLSPKYSNVSELTEEMNRTIQASGLRDVAIYLTTDSDPPMIREYNVAPLGHNPGHLVVLSCRDSIFDDNNGDAIPALRLFRALDVVTHRSDFLFDHRTRLLKTVARSIWRSDK